MFHRTNAVVLMLFTALAACAEQKNGSDVNSFTDQGALPQAYPVQSVGSLYTGSFSFTSGSGQAKLRFELRPQAGSTNGATFSTTVVEDSTGRGLQGDSNLLLESYQPTATATAGAFANLGYRRNGEVDLIVTNGQVKILSYFGVTNVVTSADVIGTGGSSLKTCLSQLVQTHQLATDAEMEGYIRQQCPDALNEYLAMVASNKQLQQQQMANLPNKQQAIASGKISGDTWPNGKVQTGGTVSGKVPQSSGTAPTGASTKCGANGWVVDGQSVSPSGKVANGGCN